MTEQEAYNKLKRLVNKANRRLQRLQSFSGKSVSWAGKYLQSQLDNEKLGAWNTIYDLIQIPENIDNFMYQRIYAATDLFLKNKSSTITGVKDIIKKTKRTLAGNFSITNAEAESLYQLLTDDTFLYIKEHSRAESSQMWALIEEAKEKRMSSTTFLKHMYEIAEVQPDTEMSQHINNLYIKEVLGV